MEIWDLYDINRNSLGKTMIRGEEIPKGEFHLTVSIMTVNKNKEVLLTLRDPNKIPYPNMWEITAGSVLSGEDTINGAVRELREETGIVAEKAELLLIDTIVREQSGTIMDVYLLHRNIDIKDVVLQEGETVDAMWADIDKIKDMIKTKKITPAVSRKLDLIEKYINN